jgi:hypothetical protein
MIVAAEAEPAAAAPARWSVGAGVSTVILGNDLFFVGPPIATSVPFVQHRSSDA